MDYKQLAQTAIDAKKMAYVPYSKFRVGAALLTKSGKTYTGCNVESAAYSPTCCAERTALVKAVSEGEKEFAAIAVAGSAEGGAPQYCYPCGVCRQFLNEFATSDMEVIVVKTADDYRVHSFDEILPHGFGPENLK
ncbi:MAG: cytidine deaminase [Defluviitaleaceae bacterium]|nr:cytidine deaminase [Defluviitaleaceae bacterium]